MNQNNDYVYIMVPVKAELLKNLSIPFVFQEEPAVPISDDENFVPLWYGNARFPEDDI